MGPARIYPWRRTQRSLAPSIAPGTFFVAQSWAGCITNMPGFNLQQAQRAEFWFPDVSGQRPRAQDGLISGLINSQFMNSLWFTAEKISHANCETLLVRRQILAKLRNEVHPSPGERRMMSARTKPALAASKARGTTMGGKRRPAP
jgi:hypothetical protein